MERFAAEAPSLFGVDNASERIRDDVQVGRNLQSVQNDIVAGIHDDRKIPRIEFFVKTEKKF
jgi:hypothetical protein